MKNSVKNIQVPEKQPDASFDAVKVGTFAKRSAHHSANQGRSPRGAFSL
jgi:hypothetical protein